MALHLYDIIAIVLYLILCVGIGIRIGGQPSDVKTYFTYRGKMPWVAVSLSVVATETSMLTVISIPAVAYLGGLQFLQLGMGYIIGRFLVAWIILPAYFNKETVTAYALFSERFGSSFRKIVSGTFLITRLLADGIRLFAAAIPLKIVTGLDYSISIVIIAILTLSYTYFGGLKSVIWIDVLQLFVYIFGGIFIIAQIYFVTDAHAFRFVADAGKLSVIEWPDSLKTMFLTPYNLVGAVIGGTFFSMASHGTDQLIVQRLLACGSLKNARKAIITSGILVFIQFSIFLVAGLMLFSWYKGASVAELGLLNPDEIVLKYVTAEVPPGIAGIIIAGLFAAAMSTLSSSLSALSSSTLFDIFPFLNERPDSLRISRLMMVVWTVIFILFATSFTDTGNPIVELGLSIAGFTYGALLGALLVARYTDFNQRAATIGFFSCIGGMILIISWTGLAWPWFTLSGIIIFYITGGAAHFFEKSDNAG